jgi:hypothetical protein
MLREQLINVLQSAVVFLVLTNIASAVAAFLVMRQAHAKPAQNGPISAIERNLQAILRRVG